MKILFSHPTGNANVRAALKGIYEAKLLGVFYTSIACFSGSLLDILSKIPQLAEIKRRQFDPALEPFTKMYGFKEFGRLASSKLGLNILTNHVTGFFSIYSACQYIDKKVSKALSKYKNLDAVYAYEDGALHSFRKAKRLNITCLYDLPIGYWRTSRILLEEERNQRPEWASTLTGFKDSAKKLESKDEELALADHIIVASSFTKQTLNDYPGELAAVTVIPYGFPPVVSGRIYPDLSNRPLKLLFVGGLSQRKGIANLLEAVALLGDAVSLTIVGHKPEEDCQPLNTALKLHHYIPSLPHDAILQLMREHDVFVFPSLFEGFGLVITEAMSQGTPVITTDRTAGADFIVNGENGWLVKAGSTASLKQCIENLVNNTTLVAQAGKLAIETARERPWDRYSKELSSFIKQHASIKKH
jgi:glycosyltransferase involved in cell wall biosynthesis